MGVEGKTYPPVTTVIEPDRVAAFAKAIGADPADGVPPTYAAVYSLGATAPQLFRDSEAEVDFGKLAAKSEPPARPLAPQPAE